jgi:hypothetical protein
MTSVVEQHRNELEILLEQFVDQVVNIASNYHQQTKFYYIAEDEDSEEAASNATLEFLSSYFLSTNKYFKSLQSEFKNAQVLIDKARNKLKLKYTITPKVHAANLHALGLASDEVKFVITKQFKEIENEGLEIYKKAENVLFKFRALLLEFKAVMLEYKRIHPDTTLKPLYVSTEIKLDI